MKRLATIGGLGVFAVALLLAGALSPFSPTAGSSPGRQRPVDATDHARDAIAVLQRSRTEADPSLIARASHLLDVSLAIQPRDNFAASLGMAALGNATHDFSGSVEWSRRAIALDPYNASPYGLLGDSLFELGRYRAADSAYQKMIDIRPDVASYVRASYAAQSHGAWDAAERAMELAIQASGPSGEEAAWLHHQMGDIYFQQQRYGDAYRANRLGTRLAPGYVPPTVGVAEALIAQGHLREARTLLERATANLPSVEYFTTLGDVCAVLGDTEAARVAYENASQGLASYRSAGVAADVDFIVFYADHGLRLRHALREARAIYTDRPTSAAADALAWVIHSLGRDRAAARYSDEAIERSAMPDALQHFHAGVIAAELGDRSGARRHLERALALDPVFSLPHALTAKELLGHRGELS